MARSSHNQRSFTTGSPSRGLFGILLPSGLDAGQASYFRRNGSSYAFQNGDRMGLGPALRLIPLFALLIAIVLGGLLVLWSLTKDGLGGREVLCALVLAALLLAMSQGLSWLLKDLTRAAIVDTRRRILWLGGGWLGRWQALNFTVLQAVGYQRIADDDQAEYPWGVFVTDLDRERYRICEELSEDLARLAAHELARRLDLPCSGGPDGI